MSRYSISFVQIQVGKIELEERVLTQDLISRVKRVYSAEHIDAVQSFLSRKNTR